MTWRLSFPDRLVCALRGHLPLLERDRNQTGAPRPHVLRWVCRRCRTDLGETVLLFDYPERKERGRWA